MDNNGAADAFCDTQYAEKLLTVAKSWWKYSFLHHQGIELEPNDHQSCKYQCFWWHRHRTVLPWNIHGYAWYFSSVVNNLAEIWSFGTDVTLGGQVALWLVVTHIFSVDWDWRWRLELEFEISGVCWSEYLLNPFSSVCILELFIQVVRIMRAFSCVRYYRLNYFGWGYYFL